MSVYTFMKSMTIQHMTADGINRLGPVLVKLADGEGLRAHAAAVTMRTEKK
ncbi:MAG: histidinol dehydrogenase [Bdellovibrionales bacterium]